MSAAANTKLERDELGRLVAVLADGTRLTGVVPVRAFPFTAPTEWIALCDEQGHELTVLRSLGELPAGERALLEEELARREFMPVVQRIRGIAPDSHPTVWLVDTDRGSRELTVPSEDHIQALEPHGAILTDVHGVRYRVLDRRALDARSRALLGRHL